MITARELVFYIRAEDQASRVVKRAARSFGSLSSIRGLENKAILQQASNYRRIEAAQQAVMRNQIAIQRAEVTTSRLGRLTKAGTPLRGYTMPETKALYTAALSNLATLRKQSELLADDEAEVRRQGQSAARAIKAQIDAATIARTENYVTAIQGVARAFRLVGIAAAASLAFAAHAAAQFQTQATLAATQSTVVGKNTMKQVLANSKFIQRQILQLEGTGKVTSSLNDQTSAAYQIFSSITLRGNQVQQLKSGISLLKQFNEVATANYGLVDLNQVTKAGIVLINRFHVSVAQMPAALSRMQAAVRFGALNMAQFVAGFNQVAPAFNAAGYSFNQMAGTMAFISRKFPNVAMGFTGLARLTETLANPKILAGLKQQGIIITDNTGHLKPLDEIIKLILQKFPKLAKGGVDLQNFFKNIGGLQSTVQARRVFVSIAQDLPGYSKMLRQVTGDNNELSKSWKAMQQTPQVQWAEFTNKLKTVVYEIGIYAIPAIISMGKYVGGAVTWFDNLSEHTKRMIAVIATFGSVAAVLGGTLLIIAGAVAKTVLAFKLLRLEKITADAERLGIAATAGKTGLKGLADEGGFVVARFAVMAPAISGALLLLMRYPHILSVVMGLFGGFGGTIKTASSIMTAMIALKTASWFAGLEIELGAATAAVGILQKALLGLTGLSPYIITVLLLYSPIKKLSKEFEKRTGTKFDFPVIGPTFEAGAELGHNAGKAFDKWLASIYPTWKQKVAQMHAKMRKDAMTPVNQIQITAMQAPTVLETILSSRMASDFTKAQARLAFIKKDYAELARILKSVTLPQLGGNKAIDNVTKGVVAASKNAAWQKLFNNVVRLQKLIDDLEAKGKVPTLKMFKELDDAEDALQKASTGNQYQAAQQMLSALESTWNTAEKSATKHSKNLLKIEKQNVQNAKTELGNLLQGVQSIYDNILSQNQTLFGELFGGPVVSGARVQDKLQFGGQVTGVDLLADIKGQVFQFNQLNRQLDTLGKRGAPKAFLDQVRALGPNARSDIKALTQLTPQQFRQYITAWNAGQRTIKANTMSQLNSQLKVYEKFGRKVAMAIIKGMQSQDQGLQSELQNIILKMFPGLAKQAKEAFKFKKVPAPKTAPKLPAHDVAPRGRRLQSATTVHNHATAIHNNTRNLQNVRTVSTSVTHGARVMNNHVNNSKIVHNLSTATRNVTISGAVRNINNNAHTINNYNNSRTLNRNTTNHNVTAQKPIIHVMSPARTAKETTKYVEQHDHYHITAPVSEHASLKTQLEHANFSIRNKFKGNL